MVKTVIIVSGGSRGLGRGIVEDFLLNVDSSFVATFSRTTTESIEELKKRFPSRFLFKECDISDGHAVAAFVNEVQKMYGSIDVLVNNAGIAHQDVVALQDELKMKKIIDVNIMGTIALTRACVRQMLTQDRGRIITITSIVGVSGFRGLSVYSLTKAGLDGFTRSLARELGGRGITVNSIAPGFLETEMTHGLNDEQRAQIVRRTPMGRLGRTEDITSLVRFLSSDDAAFITGQTIVVDGGITT